MIKVLTQIAFDWGLRCFGTEHMYSRSMRALRFAEEALELAQACDVPEETAASLVRAVYSRPVGRPLQEVGGSMLTLVVLCHILAIDPEDAMLMEIRRCLSKEPSHFAARNQEKLDLGLKA